MSDADQEVVDTVAEWCRVEGVAPDDVSVARVAGAPEIDAGPAAVAAALAELGDTGETGGSPAQSVCVDAPAADGDSDGGAGETNGGESA